ncbi:thiolase family protein [Alkalihalobacillus sp. BA299]|uniref:thiolase family protein n=1 Tax=Alkalihalobacillus sp. BA299 TaxID=2815938 RepID=UPI001ADB7B78|nr:thiolase family protein [Alkalihalobacillus sp. BA299]
MDNVVIVDGLRTPYGKLGGALKEIPAIDLGGYVLNEIINRNHLNSEEISDVIMGHVLPTDGMTPTRQAVLKAEFPITTRSLTIDRACCSAMTAIGLMRQSIILDSDIIGIAGGMENMSQTPFLIPQLRWGQRLGDVHLQDPLILRNEFLNEPRVIYVGQSALEYGVNREIQDEWALQSQENWAKAQKNGLFSEEVIPFSITQNEKVYELKIDENPRPNTNIEKLGQLSTVYGSPTITPGNASGINDGAAVTLLMSGQTCKDRGLEPLATIVDFLSISGNPRFSCTLPGEAISALLNKAGLSIDDMELIEINEAYAAMPAVSTKILAEEFGTPWEKLKEKTNVKGGAISIGHPIGSSGARITMTLAYELKRRGGGYGVAAICGGIGQADVILIKVE